MVRPIRQIGFEIFMAADINQDGFAKKEVIKELNWAMMTEETQGLHFTVGTGSLDNMAVLVMKDKFGGAEERRDKGNY